jgi:hypothetical protein
MGHFSIQPKSNQTSAPSQEIGEYKRASADRLTANVMRGIQAKEQEQAEGLTLNFDRLNCREVEGSTLQRKSESPWAPTFDAPPPLAQSPASQLRAAFAPVSENPIQRQCADCAKEEEEQAREAGKDLEEIGIQTKLTVGAPGDPYEQEADLVETLHATSLQVISMSAPPDSSASVQRQLDTNHPHHPHQMWKRAQSITPVVHRQIDPRVQMRQMIQRAAQIDGNQASFDLESRLNSSKGGGSIAAAQHRPIKLIIKDIKSLFRPIEAIASNLNPVNIFRETPQEAMGRCFLRFGALIFGAAGRASIDCAEYGLNSPQCVLSLSSLIGVLVAYGYCVKDRIGTLNTSGQQVIAEHLNKLNNLVEELVSVCSCYEGELPYPD